MEFLLSWLLVLAILGFVAAVLLPRVRQKATRKMEIPKPVEEFAEEMILDIPVSRKKTIEPEERYIPHHYGVDRLVLCAKDPRWLYAYWEVSAAKQQEFIHRYGEENWQRSRPALRVFDVTGLAGDAFGFSHSFREFTLDPWADNWFIEIGQPDRSFYAELGRILPNGSFVPLLRSNRVSTPRESVSDRLDEQWMWIEGIYQAIGKVSYGFSSAEWAEQHIVEGVREAVPLGIGSPGFEK